MLALKSDICIMHACVHIFGGVYFKKEKEVEAFLVFLSLNFIYK